jgi:uncharacterized membrane protein YbhN (UPF0104 family)
MNPQKAFKIAVTLGLVALVIALAGPRRIVGAFQGADYRLVLLALLFTPVCIFFKAYRWHLLARSRIQGLGFLPSFKSYMAGLTLAVITPVSAGELARGHHLDPKRGIELVGLVTIDKFLDLAAVGTYGFLGFMYLFPLPVKLVSGLAIACLTGGWLFLRPAARLFERLLRAAPDSRLGRFFAAVKDVSIPLIFKCLDVAFINFAFYYFQVYLVVRAFARGPVALSAVAFFPAITLSTIIPYAIGGVGIRELTAALLLSPYNITKAQASSAFFAHFILIMILPGLLGALWVGRAALPSADAPPGLDKEAP